MSYPQQPGYGYPPPQGYPQPPPKKKGMSVLGILGIVALLGFGGCLGMCALAKKGGDLQKEKFDKEEALVVSPADLVQAYKDNEVAADEKYKGKKIEITGEVKDISSNIGDQPVVHLKADKALLGVSAHGLEKSDAAKLKKGETVTLVCKGNGEVISVPSLDDCKLK